MTETPILPDSTAVVGVPDELAELSAKATQGEWTAQPYPYDDGTFDDKWYIVGRGANLSDDIYPDDARMIAASVNFVRDQIARATRSTQPEGEAGQPRWAGVMASLMGIVSAQNGNAHEDINELLTEAAEMVERAKPLPQPEAAASGDVGEIEISNGGKAIRDGSGWLIVKPLQDRSLWLSDDDLAAIRALIVQPSAPAGEWMPIETAPKDGSEFLAIDDENDCACVHWDVFWSAWYDRRTRFLATHWRPLPEPPRQPEPGSTQGGEAR